MLNLSHLTKRQKHVYEFIRDKIRNRGYGPTVREIGENFGISSPNGVMCHLKALEKKGLITREPNMSRAIQLAAEPIEERGLAAGRADRRRRAARGNRADRAGRFRGDVQQEEPVRAEGERRFDDRRSNRRRRLRRDPQAIEGLPRPDRRR